MSTPPPHRCILHVDMDAFFASVEQRDDPTLQKRPVLVGRVHRGVVAAASYEARAFGVRSAMSMAEALRRCPDARVVPPRFAAYAEASRQVFAIFARYTPQIEPLSLDEAFLDVTASLSLFGTGAQIATAIRQAILAEVGLCASAGVAPNKFVAKLASEWNKPNGLTIVDADHLAQRLAPLSVRQLLGVGKKSAALLEAAGLHRFADVQVASVERLQHTLGAWGASLVALAHGQDDRPVVADREAKSVGSEGTLDFDAHRTDALRPALWHHVLTVCSRLAAAKRWACTLTLKLKSARFVETSRQAPLPQATHRPDPMFHTAWRLLTQAPLPAAGTRLIGISASRLQAVPPMASLFASPAQEKQNAADEVRLAVERRFGRGCLTRATSLSTKNE